jgi:hypothetical protein
MRAMSAIALSMLFIIFLDSTALAAGKATITSEAFYVVPYLSRFAGDIYGEITNTGDRSVIISSGVYELYDPDGEAIESGSIYSVYPNIIEPGQKAYYHIRSDVEGTTSSADIDDYMTNVVGKTAKDVYLHLPVEARFEETMRSDNRVYRHYAVIENNSDKTLYGVEVVLAFYNVNGELLYIDYQKVYSVGITPGSRVEITGTVDSSVQNQWNSTNTEISSIVAISWFED